jgi:6-phosphofructokinase 1
MTGGGDCPGLNAVIRAVVRRAIETYEYEVVGIKSGWAGLIDRNFVPLNLYSISGLLFRGGTILGTSRTNPFAVEGGVERISDNMKRLALDALVAIGGEDTLGVAAKLYEKGLQVVGVPKTIDNDVEGTDFTVGFHTAVSVAADAIDRLQTTAESHNRIVIVEVMGRHAGWIATYAGVAGGADMVIIPEEDYDLDQISQSLLKRHSRGKNFSIVVVAEGARSDVDDDLVIQDEKTDAFGHVRLGGIGHELAHEIEKRTQIETRYTVLGHVQRGGTPTCFDRILATRFGVRAVDLIAEGNFGKMVGVRGMKIVSTPLKECMAKVKLVDHEMIEIAKVFFG